MPSHFKHVFLITCCLLLVTVLSACSTIGTPKLAALQVTSAPEASVFLDGQFLGKTPFFSDQLKEGDHLLKLAAQETEYVDKITLNAQTLTVVNRTLADNFQAQSGETLSLEDSQKGLFVISLPPAADLTLDGSLLGKTPYLTLDIADGEHKILLSKLGFISREFSIKTSKNYQLLADVTLASEIAKNINIAPSPQPSKVEVQPTPVGFLRVRSGPQLSATEIGRVKNGQQFEVIQESGDWLMIIFEAKQGWISSQYTRKL